MYSVKYTQTAKLKPLVEFELGEYSLKQRT